MRQIVDNGTAVTCSVIPFITHQYDVSFQLFSEQPKQIVLTSQVLTEFKEEPLIVPIFP
jgi:hypothetical protein